MTSPHPTTPKPPIALTIAGFDPSNGAGITADLQVFASHGLFGTSAITALTVQNTLGVAATHPVDPKILRATLRNLAADLPPAGIKIGMLANANIVREVIAFLQELQQGTGGNKNIPIVLDPIILSSSGAELLDQTGLDLLRTELIPLVTCITPNCQELARLTTFPHPDWAQPHPQRSPQNIQRSPAIITTGGDLDTVTDTLQTPDGQIHTFTSTKIETPSTHGTGCAFSSALLANLIAGKSIIESVAYAKRFVEQALRSAPGLGQGHGPMNLYLSDKK